MKKAVIFGAGITGIKVLEENTDYKILCFIDNNKSLWEKKVKGIPVLAPCAIISLDYDVIFICTTSGLDEAVLQLLSLGVEQTKIDCRHVLTQVRARERFLETLAQMQYLRAIGGSVAEAGVYRGEFAKRINGVYPDRTLYLFDTFEGFAQRDITIEKENAAFDARAFSQTTIDMVLSKMPYPERCIVKRGYFPESAAGVTDTFCFVNRDMDLYMPTLNGLRWFYPLMQSGGVILVHDYFSDLYKGVSEAVNEFVQETNCSCIPIGDSLSVAVIC